MSTDSENRESRTPAFDIICLPRILNLVIERVPFEPRKYRFVRSVQAEYREALAITIETSGPLPGGQATSPVLSVGGVDIAYFEVLGDNRYRFLAFGPEEERMKKGDPITLEWGDRAQREKQEFFYQPPASPKRKKR